MGVSSSRSGPPHFSGREPPAVEPFGFRTTVVVVPMDAPMASVEQEPAFAGALETRMWVITDVVPLPWGRFKEAMLDCDAAELDLSEERMSLENIDVLCRYASQHNMGLTELDLRSCSLDAVGMDRLALLVRQNRLIHTVDFSQNPRAGWKGAVSLFKGLSTNAFVRELNVRHNEIGPKGCWQVGETLRCNGTLETLDLSYGALCGGEGVGDAGELYDGSGVEHLFGALKFNGGLRTLVLTECGVRGGAAKTLADSLAWNRSLRVLDLSRNNLGEEGGLALAAALPADNHLENLDLRSCNIGDTATLEIASQLSLNKSLRSLNMALNGTSSRARKILHRNWHERPAWRAAVKKMVIPP